MATFVGFTVQPSMATSLTVSIPKPAGLVVGDLMVAGVYCSLPTYGDAAFATPAGWTKVSEVYGRYAPPSTDNGINYCAWWKRADAADVAAANFVFSWTGAANSASGQIAAWRGPVAFITSALDKNPFTNFQFPTTNSSIEVPSVNATSPNQLLVGLAAGLGGSPGLGTTVPLGMTRRVDATDPPAIPAQDGLMYVWDMLTSASGATVDKNVGSEWGAFAVYSLLFDENSPPLAPTLVSPANGASAPLSGTPTFSWVHNDGVGSVQSGFVIRRKVGAGAYEYYNSGTGTWQASIVSISQLAQSFTFPASKWTNGVTYNWSIATLDQYFALGPFATDRVTTAGQGPVVDVTGPTGVVTDTDSPSVGWTYFDAEGDLQTHYQLRVFTAAQYGIGGFDPNASPNVWDSGELAGPWLSALIGADLINGTTYRVYVRAKSAGQWSEWDYSQFVLTLIAPEKPILEVTHEVSAYGPRNVLEAWGDDEVGGAPNGLMLDGTAYATTPDHASLDLITDLNFRVRVRAADLTSTTQTILGKWTTNQQSYILQIGVDGKITLAWSTTGTNTLTKTSTIAVPVADGVDFWLWCVLDVDNGGGGHTAYFSYSLDDTDDHAAVAWLLVGTPVAVAGTTSVFAGTAPLEIGSVLGGTTNRFTGVIHNVVILTAALAVVYQVKFHDPAQGWESGDTGGATGTDTTGKVTTLMGGGADILALYNRDNVWFRFDYSDNAGDPDEEWFVVRGGGNVPSDPGDEYAIYYDYEMPPDATRTYRVTVIGELT